MHELKRMIRAVKRLEKQFDQYLRSADQHLIERYTLIGKNQHAPAHTRSLPWWRRKSKPQLRPWQAGLKHNNAFAQEQHVLLFDAIGREPEVVESACQNLDQQLRAAGGYIPVLLTDVDRFGFYSRLGWAVEYLPAAEELSMAYRKAKLNWLALRYHDARKLPLEAGFLTDDQWLEILNILT